MLGDKKRVEVSGVIGRESRDSGWLGKLESRLGYDKCESCKCCAGESAKRECNNADSSRFVLDCGECSEVESCEVKSNKAKSCKCECGGEVSCKCRFCKAKSCELESRDFSWFGGE